MADQIEWDLDAGLPMYTRDFIRNLPDVVLGVRIDGKLYSPEEVEFVINFGQGNSNG